MNNLRELLVWQKSISFVVRIYEITRRFPDEERYNLISQMQRSSTSIPSNVAEGAGRNTKTLFKQFLSIAIGSAHELETQIIICKKLSYLSEEIYGSVMIDLTEIQKMLYGLYGSI